MRKYAFRLDVSLAALNQPSRLNCTNLWLAKCMQFCQHSVLMLRRIWYLAVTNQSNKQTSSQNSLSLKNC